MLCENGVGPRRNFDIISQLCLRYLGVKAGTFKITPVLSESSYEALLRRGDMQPRHKAEFLG
jgi:hypothetical protein